MIESKLIDIKIIFKKQLEVIFHYFIFSNFFISLVAIVMLYGTCHFLQVRLDPIIYYIVFLSTLSSYGLHWYFTSQGNQHILRDNWNKKYKYHLIIHFLVGAIILSILFILNAHLFKFFMLAAIATFIYTAPKLPIPGLQKLEGKALAKTFYLSLIWTYVTCILPILISNSKLNAATICYIACYFLFIYLICLIFDYRDQDKESFKFILLNTNKHFYKIIIILSVLFFILMAVFQMLSNQYFMILGLAISFLIVLLTLKKSTRTSSDYWYYCILDGLMMLPVLVNIFLTIVLKK